MRDKENRNKPTLIMKDENIKSICCFGSSNMILKNNGELFVFGYNNYGKFKQFLFNNLIKLTNKTNIKRTIRNWK